MLHKSNTEIDMQKEMVALKTELRTAKMARDDHFRSAQQLAHRYNNTRASIIAMIEAEAAKRHGRGIKRLADILTGAIAARFDEKDAV